ncbi:MAG: 16S rRNA (guanine(527)-N(7))-methyltransferase RsmG [Ignavibacteria bacterium]|nr:16S rRNA (guanine(527)-N(7))-methyltransferase RsmG [Ignavibacteria bacterium]
MKNIENLDQFLTGMEEDDPDDETALHDPPAGPDSEPIPEHERRAPDMQSINGTQVRATLEANGIALSDQQSEQLSAYVRLLLEWNHLVNLISRKDEDQVWRNHILHSLAACAVLPLPADGVYVDIGTGGGLPGIPLAILFPDARFTLVDSIAKKMRAVEFMASALKLKNVHCLVGRVEDAGALAVLRETADVVCARAVTELSALVAWAHPLLRADGGRRLLAWKGGELDEEVHAARRSAGVDSIVIHSLALKAEDYFVREDKKIVEVRFHAS